MLALLPFFFFQAEDGIRDLYVTGVQTCALPISHTTCQATGPAPIPRRAGTSRTAAAGASRSRRSARCSARRSRSEEHTSELQSRRDLVCRLLLEKKKNKG